MLDALKKKKELDKINLQEIHGRPSSPIDNILVITVYEKVTNLILLVFFVLVFPLLGLFFMFHLDFFGLIFISVGNDTGM